MERFVGIDFGTTNSSVAMVDRNGESQLARFPTGDGTSSVFRSILFFDPDEREANGRLVPSAGPEALARWREASGAGRLMQSLKSFLASRLFTSTNVFGTVLSLETLIGHLLRGLRTGAERSLGPLGKRAVVGRPVRFVGAETGDESLALSRLRAAFASAGFSDVVFEPEPVAAAWHYEQRLDHDELVLIGDFGGGTSDFCLLRVGPGVRTSRGGEAEVIGTEGVGLAGDAFDGCIVREAVSPALGRGSEFRSIFGRVLPVPGWIYRHLERWNHLVFLRMPDTLHLLHQLAREALEPRAIEALLHIVEQDLGFALHQRVEGVKCSLSNERTARLRFADGPVGVDRPIERNAFEHWIGSEVRAIEGAVERLLASSGISAGDVDAVFLTGGSSLVPAVRSVFADRFGPERIRSGAELTSVASGLALRAATLAR